MIFKIKCVYKWLRAEENYLHFSTNIWTAFIIYLNENTFILEILIFIKIKNLAFYYLPNKIITVFGGPKW